MLLARRTLGEGDGIARCTLGVVGAANRALLTSHRPLRPAAWGGGGGGGGRRKEGEEEEAQGGGVAASSGRRRPG